MDLQLLVSRVTNETGIEAPQKAIYDAVNDQFDINDLKDIDRACGILYQCNAHLHTKSRATLQVSIKAMDSQIFIMKPYYNLTKFEEEFV